MRQGLEKNEPEFVLNQILIRSHPVASLSSPVEPERVVKDRNPFVKTLWNSAGLGRSSHVPH